MDPFLGEIRLFSFAKMPTGWMACQGQILQIKQYTALYSLLSTQYGGDGVNTFGVPDLRGRVPLAQSPTYTMGQTGGAESVVLTANQLPPHTHMVAASSQPATSAAAGSAAYLAQIAVPATPANAPAAPAMFVPPSPTTVALAPAGIETVGGGSAHENRQPYLPLNYCIATTGLYPARN